MSDKTYNGWTNYETWLVKLWMDNDQGSSEHWQERAQEVFKVDGDESARSLADLLKDEHEEHYLEVLRHAKQECSLLSDLIGAAMSEVNWHEIAESLLADHVEEYGKEQVEA